MIFGMEKSNALAAGALGTDWAPNAAALVTAANAAQLHA
jgi:hypothetical protein